MFALWSCHITSAAPSSCVVRVGKSHQDREECHSRTVAGDITHRIRPVLLVFRLPFILAQLTGEMAQDGIALRQDLAVQLDDGDVACRVEFGNFGLFYFGELVEAVADVFVGYAGVLSSVDGVSERKGGGVVGLLFSFFWSMEMEIKEGVESREGTSYLPQ